MLRRAGTRLLQNVESSVNSISPGPCIALSAQRCLSSASLATRNELGNSGFRDNNWDNSGAHCFAQSNIGMRGFSASGLTSGPEKTYDEDGSIQASAPSSSDVGSASDVPDVLGEGQLFDMCLYLQLCRCLCLSFGFVILVGSVLGIAQYYRVQKLASISMIVLKIFQALAGCKCCIAQSLQKFCWISLPISLLANPKHLSLHFLGHSCWIKLAESSILCPRDGTHDVKIRLHSACCYGDQLKPCFRIRALQMGCWDQMQSRMS